MENADNGGIVWSDRKRIAFGLPWTFTKYTLTKEKLLIHTGMLNTQEDEVRLYRIMDVTLRRSQRGDLLAIKSAGAYGMSMASRYNLHDLPGAVYSDEIE